MNSEIIKGLKPEKLWRRFAELSEIPRCSKNEKAARDYIAEIAEAAGLEQAVDSVGNLVVRVPASKGRQSTPVVIVQSHLDMVCEKNREMEFDFSTEGIRLKLTDGRIHAEGTTLGADNGIGVAAAIALVETDAPHGPLELLFTIDEETGLTGAAGLDPKILVGRNLINLDSEDFGVITIGCAGGAEADIFAEVEWEKPEAGGACSLIELKGLAGGHSGVDIDKNRGNAVMMLARFLAEASRKIDFRIGAISGGDKFNAIPREARAMVTSSKEARVELAAAGTEFVRRLTPEISIGDPAISISPTDPCLRVFTDDFRKRLLGLIAGIPSGPIDMSDEVLGLVMTSNNLGIFRTEENRINIGCFIRSSIDERMEAVAERIGMLAEGLGAELNYRFGFSGWRPDPDSKLLALAFKAGSELFDEPFTSAAMHAGLECGIIGAKIPGMQMISLGPDIRNPHSPDEYVDAESVEKFYRHLEKTLELISAAD